MSLATPQTVTVNAIAKTLNRISSEKTASVFKTDDGVFELKVSHQINGKRTRRMARLDHVVIAADPLTAVNASQKAGIYIVIDEPAFGYSDAELEYDVNALKTWLSSANILAMLAGRH